MAMASIANCHKLPVYPMIIPFFTIVNPLLNQEKSPFLVVKTPFPIGCSSPFLQCEAPKIAKLVYNSNNYGLWYLYITIVTGANLNQLITGGGHIVLVVRYVIVITRGRPLSGTKPGPSAGGCAGNLWATRQFNTSGWTNGVVTGDIIEETMVLLW